eukprot:scaffold124810_cov14-Tisochrysis_lutea.AAC.1
MSLTAESGSPKSGPAPVSMDLGGSGRCEPGYNVITIGRQGKQAQTRWASGVHDPQGQHKY